MINRRLGWRQLVTARSKEFAPYLSNWLWIAAAAAVTFPSRIPPRGGLFGRRLGRLQVTLRFRNGFRLKCRLDELEGYYSAYAHRDYEGGHTDWATVASVADVGANVGAATLWFAGNAPAARIISVEPDPYAFSRLVTNIGRSGLEHRVTPIAAALGGGPGLASLETERWSVVTRARNGVRAGLPAVGQLSLEALIDSCGLARLDVLKLDCEGAEYDVLLSAPPSVLSRIQAIVAECHVVPEHGVAELEDYLSAAGFSVVVSDKPGHAGMLAAFRGPAGFSRGLAS